MCLSCAPTKPLTSKSIFFPAPNTAAPYPAVHNKCGLYGILYTRNTWIWI